MWTFFRKPPPPPKPIYARQPIATAAVILTIIGMFVFGPIGVIYNSMSEELKGKANNETVILYMKQQKETDDRQWKALEQQIQVPQNMSVVATPKQNLTKKMTLTVEQFEKYISMVPEIRAKYKFYLESTGFDVSGLPN